MLVVVTFGRVKIIKNNQMKKILFLALLVISNMAVAQFNPEAPWMKELKTKEARSRSVEVKDKTYTLSEISAAFNDYWKDKDYKEKGSGYKPFKRWENRVKGILMADGTIPTAQYLFETNLAEHNRFASSNNVSNWRSTGPMTDKTGQGRVNVAMVDPNNPDIYYVGAPSGGLWRSTDKGTSWEPLTDKLPAIGVSGIAIDPKDSNIIYISTGDDDNADSYGLGVFKTTDGGRTWNTKATYTPELSGYMRGGELYIHPNNSNILWNATSQGLYKTVDAGSNWTLVYQGYIRDLKLKPNNPDVLYIIDGHGFGNKLLKSTDGGINFIDKSRAFPDILSRAVIDVTPVAPENLYLLEAKDIRNQYGGILYKSENAAESFVELNRNLLSTRQSWYDWTLAVSDVNPDHIALGAIFGKISKDGGRSFSFVNYGHADVHFLRFNAGTLFCGNDGGFITMDERGNINDHSKELNIGQYYKINIADVGGADSNLIIGGTQDNGGQFYRNNTWKRWHGADGMDCAIGSSKEGLLYGLMQNGELLFYSKDYGAKMFSMARPAEVTHANWVVASDINSKDEMYVGYQALYKADLLSNSFVKLHNFSYNIKRIIISDNDDNVIFVLAHDGNVYKSTNAGKTFNLYYDGGNTVVLNMELSQDDSNKIWFVTAAPGIQTKMFSANSLEATANGALTLVSDNLPLNINVIKHQPYSNILYIGSHFGLYYKDGDKPWALYDNNLPNVPIRDLEISVEDKVIVAGTYGRGVWKSPIPDGNRTSCVLNVPTAPTTVIELEGILVSWGGEKKLQDYEVHYKKVSDRDWLTKTIGENSTFLTQEQIQEGVEYELKVRSTCNGAYSEFTSPIRCAWLDVDPPSAPTYFGVYRVTKTTVELSWMHAIDNKGISHYEFYNQVERDSVYLGRTEGTETYYTLDTLIASTEYNLYVVAVDAAGNKSEGSNLVNFKTKSVFMPDAPQNLIVVENTGLQAVLKWDAPIGTEEVKAYEVYDYQYGLLATTTEKQVTLNNLPSNFWFNVYVRAIGIDDSKSDGSNDVGFKFDGINDRQPNPPTNIIVVNEEYTNVVLNWDVPQGNVAISHYEVYLENGYIFEDRYYGNKKVGTSPTNAITITSLEPNKIYWGNIVAVGVEGVKSLPSDYFQIIVKGEKDKIPPTAPTNLRTRSITSSTVEIAWDLSTDNVGVAYYEVFQQIDGRNVKVGESKEANWLVEKLEPFTQYTFYVTARDFEGNSSEFSQPLTVFTTHKEFPERPYGLSASRIENNSFVASWSKTLYTDHYYVSSYDGVTVQEFGPLRDTGFEFKNIATPFLYWRVIAENELGRMYSEWELTDLNRIDGKIDVVLNGAESQQTINVSKAYENADYTLYSLSGILIRRGAVKENVIQVANLRKGVYVLKINDDLKPFTKKVVIK